jgi:hypothetical protein
MQGSAVVEETAVGAGPERVESFAMQCYERARGKWVRYELDDKTPRFRRFEGALDDSGVAFAGAPGPGSSGASGTLVVSRAVEGKLQRVWREGDENVWEEELRRRDR